MAPGEVLSGCTCTDLGVARMVLTAPSVAPVKGEPGKTLSGIKEVFSTLYLDNAGRNKVRPRMIYICFCKMAGGTST